MGRRHEQQVVSDATAIADVEYVRFAIAALKDVVQRKSKACNERNAATPLCPPHAFVFRFVEPLNIPRIV